MMVYLQRTETLIKSTSINKKFDEVPENKI